MVKRKSRLYRWEVSGSGSFPRDMLRYDMCEIIDEEGPTITCEGPREPTIARWNSFLWSVSDVRRAK